MATFTIVTSSTDMNMPTMGTASQSPTALLACQSGSWGYPEIEIHEFSSSVCTVSDLDTRQT